MCPLSEVPLYIFESLFFICCQSSLFKDPLLMFGGRAVIDTGSLHYYGNSLGGILGDVYMAVTTDVTLGKNACFHDTEGEFNISIVYNRKRLSTS